MFYTEDQLHPWDKSPDFLRRAFLSLSPFLLPSLSVGPSGCALMDLSPCASKLHSLSQASISGFHCSPGFTMPLPLCPVHYPGVCLSVLIRSSCFSCVLSSLCLEAHLHIGLYWQFEEVAIIRQMNILSEIIQKLRFVVLRDKFASLLFSLFSWPLKTPLLPTNLFYFIKCSILDLLKSGFSYLDSWKPCVWFLPTSPGTSFLLW